MANQNKGTLFLLPNSLGGDVETYATEQAKSIAAQTLHFVVEEIKSARRLLRALGVQRNFEEVQFYSLNEHTPKEEVESYLLPLLQGHDMAIISEAGLPCVADPGSALVALAQAHQLKVVPLSGPSSILMALMASGLNGQQFCFNGYIPRDRADRQRKVRQMEQVAMQGITQIFMDAPYRNQSVVDDVLAHCKPETLLCIASNISTRAEMIVTKSIREWRLLEPQLPKEPIMFLIGK